MRELIGTRNGGELGITTTVYRSELIYCRECRKTVPIGIEVITTRQEKNAQTVLRHQYLCRLHGMEFETMTHRQLSDRSVSAKPKSWSSSDSYLRNFSKRS